MIPGPIALSGQIHDTGKVSTRLWISGALHGVDTLCSVATARAGGQASFAQAGELEAVQSTWRHLPAT